MDLNFNLKTKKKSRKISLQILPHVKKLKLKLNLKLLNNLTCIPGQPPHPRTDEK